jgi:DNA-binding NarL/FixJ family response regulator
MPRPLTVRKPRRAEIDYLNTVLEQELTAGQRRRAEVLVLHAAGLEGTDIARVLDVHVNTVYADLKAFARREDFIMPLCAIAVVVVQSR